MIFSLLCNKAQLTVGVFTPWGSELDTSRRREEGKKANGKKRGLLEGLSFKFCNAENGGGGAGVNAGSGLVDTETGLSTNRNFQAEHRRMIVSTEKWSECHCSYGVSLNIQQVIMHVFGSGRFIQAPLLDR